ncbi:MAG: IS200/IS605 family transposase [Cyclobacteriaceae bacterium]
MPYLKIWLHIVWSTKNREPLLEKPIRQRIFDHIRENAKEKGIYIDHINGHNDHVHCLVSLMADQTVAKIVQLIKGESSHWVNQNQITSRPFGWQTEYFAMSVSQSQVDRVRAYIRNQESHHREVSFAEEYELMMDKYGFEKMSG